jgi:hypothetical protein
LGRACGPRQSLWRELGYGAGGRLAVWWGATAVALGASTRATPCDARQPRHESRAAHGQGSAGVWSHEQRIPATTSRTLSAVTRPRAVARPVTRPWWPGGSRPARQRLQPFGRNHRPGRSCPESTGGHNTWRAAATWLRGHRGHDLSPGRFGGHGCPVTVTVAGPGHRTGDQANLCSILEP